jgi:N-acetylglutamate synthase
MNNFEFREMVIEDYPQVFELWENTVNIGLNETDSEENTRKFLHRNPGMSFIAVSGNKIIGTILCGHDGRRGYIYHMAVDKEFRRKGIGNKLLELCLKRLSEENIKRCHIFVFKKNKKGFLFWENAGFRKRNDIIVMTRYAEIGGIHAEIY